MSNKPEVVRVIQKGCGKITLGGLEEGEETAIQGVLAGATWMAFDKETGRLKFVPFFEDVPRPVEDPMIAPHWPSADRTATPYIAIQGDLFPGESNRFVSFGLVVQHLCGYDYTPEGYKREARALESWGFECLRSRRGPDGRFDEMWTLPGLWCARGDLRDVIDKAGGPWGEKKEASEAAIHFLCRNSSFGTLDLKYQVAAMSID